MDAQKLEGHGLVGQFERRFNRLLPEGESTDEAALAALADRMALHEDEGVEDEPDPEENLFVPAGYTYFGQFIDHDLTLDTTSSLDARSSDTPSNLRTPVFDLDCLYGAGPADQPYLYDASGTKLLFGRTNNGAGVHDDLLRVRENGRAVIGDKRNDENSIVCQIQLAFIKFHNEVVDILSAEQPALRGRALFEAARQEVRWTYQRLVVEDYLPRIVDKATLDKFDQDWRAHRNAAYRLYTPDKWGLLPREFVAAAYRFGHSMVRTGYRLNTDFARRIFEPVADASNSLVGFEPLEDLHAIDHWSRFFPDNALPAPGRAQKNEQPGPQRLQYAYRIDTTLVDPLAKLPAQIANPADLPASVAGRPGTRPPSLALLNLLRGNSYRLPSGQQLEAVLGVKLEAPYLCVRRATDDGFVFEPLDAALQARTPLWFYVLAEAQKPLVDLWLAQGKAPLTDEQLLGTAAGASESPGTRLGEVGGRIVAEVFYGVLDSDPTSFRAAPATWTPLIMRGGQRCSMWSLLMFAGLPA